jgi:RHS repeat-associated protein
MPKAEGVALISQQRYLPFGGVRTNVTTPNSPNTDFGYTGQRNLDDEIGLMDYKARFYSPVLNRFIQPDTVVPSPVEPQSWNKYSYTENNPIKYTDPTGHWVETAFDVISLGMTINDIKNEGFTFWNTVSLVTDVASIVLPAVPAGASHIIRAAKYADKAVDIVDTAADTLKASDKLAQFANYVGDVCSFSADTKVSTNEGEKEIADIEEGDYVLAWNETTNEIGYYEVTDTFSHIDPVLTELIINGEWIETTPEHPFYTLEEGWIPADELETGMHVRNAEGDYELVWLKWNIQKDQEMYNFTVDTAHTYFVGEGQWLVHNECAGLIDPKFVHYMQDYAKDKFSDGKKWLDLANGLKNGSIDPLTIPPIRIFEDSGKLWTMDHRRLAAFEYAEKEIPYIWATAKEIKKNRWKFSTENGGLSILITGINKIIGGVKY